MARTFETGGTHQLLYSDCLCIQTVGRFSLGKPRSVSSARECKGVIEESCGHTTNNGSLA
jgi:hypothetical protein